MLPVSPRTLGLWLTPLVVVLAAATVAQPIELLGTGTAGLVGMAPQGPLGQPVAVDSFAEYAAVFGPSSDGLANPHLAPSVQGFFVNGGARAYVVRVVGPDDVALVAGLQVLADVDEVAMVAVPGAVSSVVQNAMIAHATVAADRIAILDPASLDDVATVVAQRQALLDPAGHGALYFPWIEASGRVTPPSGFVAGVFARTAPPDSPVGPVATATGLSHDVTPAEQDILNPLGINAIRQFPGQGVLVWGARTLSSDPEWRYVAVRRTGLVLRESIHDGTAWAVDEPNDETLWAQLRETVDAFMLARWQDGWFQGMTPDDGFFVRCDLTTMTPEDLAAGRTVILVGFAPLQPAEFVILRIVHERSATAVVPASGGAVRLAAPVPNPANPGTRIGFTVARDGVVRLTIHDLAGRLVRTLVAGDVLAAGPHDRRWDGRDDGGRTLPSGVYLARLSAGREAATRRVTLVR